MSQYIRGNQMKLSPLYKDSDDMIVLHIDKGLGEVYANDIKLTISQ